jgi:hypothetical protein
VALAGVCEDLAIAGEEACAEGSRGGHDDAVGWIAVEWLRQTAADERDLGS